MGAGRPKEPFIPWDGWIDDILGLYAEGASDVEIRGLLGEKLEDKSFVSNDLWYRWMDEDTTFSETIKRGRELCEIWWQRSGRKNLENKEYSYTGWYMNMKNRFGWKDKHEVDSNINATVQMRAEIRTEVEQELLGKKVDEVGASSHAERILSKRP